MKDNKPDLLVQIKDHHSITPGKIQIGSILPGNHIKNPEISMVVPKDQALEIIKDIDDAAKQFVIELQKEIRGLGAKFSGAFKGNRGGLNNEEGSIGGPAIVHVIPGVSLKHEGGRGK